MSSPAPEVIFKTPEVSSVKRLSERLKMIFAVDKYSSLRARLLSIELLKLLKKRLTYKQLSELTGLSPSILCRYVKGFIVPMTSQSLLLMAALLESIDVDRTIRNFIDKEKSITIDLSRLFKDPDLSKLVSFILLGEFAGRKVNKILVGASTVLPIAAYLASEIDSDVIIAKRRKYLGVSYYEEVIVRSAHDVETIYVDRDLISKRDYVAIITDLMITGRTMRALMNIVSKAKAELVNAIAIVAIGNDWRKRVGSQIKYLSYLDKLLTGLPTP
ncbi:MAG: hypothetical protein N3E36_05140 [Sulfolobales archaeon]|nr:hypothetical protein [Sulfolobales archaeon]MCX8199395.1 hypothetical protein [Sulfolobales archaeon]MDW8170291.1 hypothetical protein [Desulfurococcaceae archaeon]